MTVTLETVYRGVERYITNELAPKATGLAKFMVYFTLPSIPNKINQLITQYQSLISSYFDSDGNILLDDLYHAAKQAMSHTIQFEYLGFIFKDSDIDLIYNFIKEAN